MSVLRQMKKLKQKDSNPALPPTCLQPRHGWTHSIISGYRHYCHVGKGGTEAGDLRPTSAGPAGVSATLPPFSR